MKVRRAGRFTAALGFVVLGLALLADNLMATGYTATLIRFWPAILIAVGLEYLFWSQREDQVIRLDWGGLMVLAVIAVLTSGLTGANTWFNPLHMAFGTIGGPAVYEHQVEKTVPAAQVRMLEVKSGSTLVEVVPGTGDDIRFTLSVQVRGMTPENARENAQHVLFDVWPGSTTRTEVSLNNLSTGRALLRIEVPTRLDINADAGSGGIRITGMQHVRVEGSSGGVRIADLSGNLTGSSGSGGIEATGIQGDVHLGGSSGHMRITEVGGGVNVEAGSGGATIRDVTGEVDLEGSSGALRVEDARGRVKAVAGSGGVIVRASEVGGPYDLRASSGSIDLTLPPSAGVQVEARTRGGGISGPAWLQRGERQATGMLGPGTFRVNLETGSGGIRVNN